MFSTETSSCSENFLKAFEKSKLILLEFIAKWKLNFPFFPSSISFPFLASFILSTCFLQRRCKNGYCKCFFIVVSDKQQNSRQQHSILHFLASILLLFHSPTFGNCRKSNQTAQKKEENTSNGKCRKVKLYLRPT